jgi:hypothetical protein
MNNGYPQHFIDSIIKSGRNNPPPDIIPQGTVGIPYVKGISEKFQWIGNRYNIKTVFKTKRALRGTLMTTRPTEMCNRQGHVCTVSPVTVADVISAKQVELWKYA